MSTKARYLFQVSMDVAPEKEALFNEVYDTEHVPYLLEVKGVISVSRARSVPFKVTIGGEVKDMPAGTPRYTALYTIESPEVLTSAAWAEAVERGRWAPEVRAHTFNRSHQLMEIMD
jgi:hypothetical protein